MPSFGEALRFWLKLGFINFGGPAGQIAIMHEELVDRKKWIPHDRFMHALNYCMFLPGPEAMQLATYVGWLLHGTWGGLVAGLLFVLPGAVFMMALSIVYATWGEVPWINGLFRGLGPVVVAIVASAVVRVAKKSLKTGALRIIALAAFLALFLFAVPFPAVVLGAAIIGYIAFRKQVPTVAAEPVLPAPPVSRWYPLRVLVVYVALWAAPIVALGLTRGWNDNLVALSIFFSIAAMVTFGGAYAVLGYVADAAVRRYAWLAPGEMTIGLGFAESTPGPLILTLQFVGFLAGYKHPPAGWSPMATGVVGALLTLWTTFVPCFLWIFLGAPYIERLRGHRTLDAMFSAVTAAVVGVILDLALTLGIRVLFRSSHEIAHGHFKVISPDWPTIDWLSLAVAVIAFGGLLRWKWNVVAVVGAGAALGLARVLLVR